MKMINCHVFIGGGTTQSLEIFYFVKLLKKWKHTIHVKWLSKTWNFIPHDHNLIRFFAEKV